ncbi:hypothetical protein Q9R19_07470 [Microbacterium sp. ARD32]|uniref:hypothetical protein n=1 Tax=Microbacterium sp. ARD32 TaxID=2962577 RepID=UPI0028829E3F|nr:hypothetical protein [Microbacterium sp. ARD32]MDT0157458.1 hypothetical protein [Microbacterium sp. ARD32]
MQLGTRWAAGAEPPASVPAALRSAIAEVESRLAGSLTPSKDHWTLTWLEGRPLAELDAGWEVLLTASGDVIARPFED